LTFQLIGTASNAAVQKYLNLKQVPQLFAGTGASKFTDPKNFPWTIGFNPNYQTEAASMRVTFWRIIPTQKSASSIRTTTSAGTISPA